MAPFAPSLASTMLEKDEISWRRDTLLWNFNLGCIEKDHDGTVSNAIVMATRRTVLITSRFPEDTELEGDILFEICFCLRQMRRTAAFETGSTCTCCCIETSKRTGWDHQKSGFDRGREGGYRIQGLQGIRARQGGPYKLKNKLSLTHLCRKNYSLLP